MTCGWFDGGGRRAQAKAPYDVQQAAAAASKTSTEANVAAAGLADRIKLEHVDAKGLPYADESFAAVMSNSAGVRLSSL